MTYADQIKAARLAAGLSQDKMAEMTGIPRRTLQDWEAGKRTPPEYVQVAALDHLCKIASVKGKRYKLRMFRNCFDDAKENPFWYEVLTLDNVQNPMSFARASEAAAYVEELEAQGYTESR